MALRTDPAVQAAAGGLACLALGERRLELGKIGGARHQPEGAVQWLPKAVAALPGEHLRLVDDRERRVESGEGKVAQPAVDHVGGAPAVSDRLGDGLGSGYGVAGGEDPGEGRLQGDRVGLKRPRTGGGEEGEGGRVGSHPDGDDGHVAAQLVAGGVVVAGYEASRLVEDRDAALELDGLDGRRAAEPGDAPAGVEPDALVQGLTDLPGVGGHLAAPLQADHVHRGRAQAAGAPRRVDGDVAAADDHHHFAGEVGRVTEPDVAEEVEGCADATEALLAGDAKPGRPRCPGGHEHRVEPLPAQFLEVVDPLPGDDLDAQVDDVGHVALDDLRRQPVGGDGEAGCATRRGGRLEDPDAVSLARQLPGGGEPCRSGADHRYPLAIRGRPLGCGRLGQCVVGVGDEALETPYRHRAFEAAPGALGFAGRVAGTPEGPDEGCGLGHQAKGLLVLAAAHQGDVAVSLDPRRAAEGARRGAGALDERLLGDGLGERDVGGAPRDHLPVELVRDGHRTGRLAEAAPGAERLVDEARGTAHRDLEAPLRVAPDTLHQGLGEDGHVGVVGRRRHLGRRDAAGAVEGRKDLAEQDHLAPDRRFLLDHKHTVAHVAELDRGLHATDPAPDDQRVVGRRRVHRRLRFHGRERLGEAAHLAGERLGADRADGRHLHPASIDPPFGHQRLGRLHDARRARRAVREVAALLAVSGDEHPVETMLEGMEDPARPHPAGAGQADHDHLRRVVHVRAARQVDARVGDGVGREDEDAGPMGPSVPGHRGGGLQHGVRSQLTWPGE